MPAACLELAELSVPVVLPVVHVESRVSPGRVVFPVSAESVELVARRVPVVCLEFQAPPERAGSAELGVRVASAERQVHVGSREWQERAELVVSPSPVPAEWLVLVAFKALVVQQAEPVVSLE